jgi:hypothetical protein
MEGSCEYIGINTTMLSGSLSHSMARPQVVDGGDGLYIWRVAVNILVLIPY